VAGRARYIEEPNGQPGGRALHRLHAKRYEVDRYGRKAREVISVYHQHGIDLLTKVVPADNILFASEMVGAVKGIDLKTGQYFDDTRRYVDNTPNLSAADKQKTFEGNALKVYPRLKGQIEKQRGNA
jgi:hypothetical protein